MNIFIQPGRTGNRLWKERGKPSFRIPALELAGHSNKVKQKRESMFKKFVYRVSKGLILTAYLLGTSLVFGHAVVTESSLRGQPLEAQKAARVMLNFNSGVELSLSKFDLVRKGDIHEAIGIRQGSKPGQIIVAVPPLSPGDYAIHYKVFAADGHLTEDIIRFHIAGNSEQ